MTYVYIMRSLGFPDQIYIGCTNDLKSRLVAHNLGNSPHTSKYLPWELAVFIGFEDEDKAWVFEQYLKSGSGRAFANKHLL